MFKSVFLARVVAISGLCLAALGCGGGSTGASSTGSNGGTSVSVSYAVSVALQGPDGPVTSVSQGATYDAVATVLEERQTTAPGFPTQTVTKPAKGIAVTFETDGGTLSPASGKVVTDDKGKASAKLTVGGVAGAASLTATAKGESDTMAFEVASVMAPEIKLTLTNDAGQAINSLEPNGRARVQVLARTVETKADGTTTGKLKPAEGVKVTVSSDGGVTDPADGSVLTDADGRGELAFKAGDTGGAFLLNASGTINGKDVTRSLGYSVQAPAIEIGMFNIEETSLGSGGSTSIHVTVLGPDGKPYDKPLAVDFTSDCVAAGSAVITPTVMTINGNAVANYTANACTGTDTITASVNVPGRSLPLTASGKVQIAPPSAGSVVFVEADPTSIALSGRGSTDVPETTRVAFKVTSAGGAPVPGVLVNFTLTSQAGGLHLLAASGQTDGAGEVSVRVQSGAVPTVFRVIASVGSSGISTQSGQITVSTGYPVQGSLSLSASELNPEAWNYDGVEVDVIARAADIFGNPVPDGTLIQFTAEGGSVEPSCATTNGACTTTWRSQAPRPSNGRVSLLATTAGDERFTDTNGNGVFDAGDTWQDLPEAWRDDNENRRYDVGEFYLDANANNLHDQGNGVYDGALCNGSRCGTSGAVDVRDDLVLTMSTSQLSIRITPDPIYVNSTSSAQVRIAISDMNGNLPPVGTQVTVTASQGQLSGTDNLKVGNSNGRGPWVTVVTLSGNSDDTTTATTGTLNVTAKTPNGTVSMNQAKIVDGGPGGGGGCGFSPCPGSLAAPVMAPADVDALNVSTETLSMDAPGSTSIGLNVAGLKYGQGLVPNVRVVMSCTASPGMTITPKQATFLTTIDTRTQVVLDLDAREAGQGVCEFRAGRHVTQFTVQAR